MHCRHFPKALSSEPEQAKEAVALTTKLFEIERECKYATAERWRAAQKQRAGPVVDALYKWCA